MSGIAGRAVAVMFGFVGMIRRGLAAAGRARRLPGATVIAVVAFLFAVTNLRPYDGRGFDDCFYYMHLTSPLFDGDWNFANDFMMSANNLAGFMDILMLTSPKGIQLNMFAVGSALLWLPFFLVAWLVGAALTAVGAVVPAVGAFAQTAFGHRFAPGYLLSVTMGSVAYGVAGMLLVRHAAMRLFGNGHAATAGAIVAGLASPVAGYMMAFTAMSHACSFFAAAMFLVVCLHCGTFRRGARDGLALGAALGLLSLVRWQDAVYGLVPFALWLGVLLRAGRDPRARATVLPGALGCVLGFCAVFAVQNAIWFVQHGSMLTMPQGQGYMEWRNPKFALVLTSGWHGLFYHHPLLLVGAVGLAWAAMRALVRKQSDDADEADADTAPPPRAVFLWACLAVFAVGTYVNACPMDAFGGSAFGARRFASLAPLLGIGFAAVATRSLWWVVVGVGVVANALILKLYVLGVGDVYIWHELAASGGAIASHGARWFNTMINSTLFHDLHRAGGFFASAAAVVGVALLLAFVVRVVARAVAPPANRVASGPWRAPYWALGLPLVLAGVIFAMNQPARPDDLTFRRLASDGSSYALRDLSGRMSLAQRNLELDALLAKPGAPVAARMLRLKPLLHPRDIAAQLDPLEQQAPALFARLILQLSDDDLRRAIGWQRATRNPISESERAPSARVIDATNPLDAPDEVNALINAVTTDDIAALRARALAKLPNSRIVVEPIERRMEIAREQFARGHFARAEATVRRALRTNPWHPPLLELAGNIREAREPHKPNPYRQRLIERCHTRLDLATARIKNIGAFHLYFYEVALNYHAEHLERDWMRDGDFVAIRDMWARVLAAGGDNKYVRDGLARSAPYAEILSAESLRLPPPEFQRAAAAKLRANFAIPARRDDPSIPRTEKFLHRLITTGRAADAIMLLKPLMQRDKGQPGYGYQLGRALAALPQDAAATNTTATRELLSPKLPVVAEFLLLATNPSTTKIGLPEDPQVIAKELENSTSATIRELSASVTDPTYFLLVGKHLFARGDHAGAAEILELARPLFDNGLPSRAHPQTADYYFTLALAQMNLATPKATVRENLRRAADAEPTSPDLAMHLSQSWRDESTTEAAAALTRALSATTNDAARARLTQALSDLNAAAARP